MPNVQCFEIVTMPTGQTAEFIIKDVNSRQTGLYPANTKIERILRFIFEGRPLDFSIQHIVNDNLMKPDCFATKVDLDNVTLQFDLKRSKV